MMRWAELSEVTRTVPRARVRARAERRTLEVRSTSERMATSRWICLIERSLEGFLVRCVSFPTVFQYSF
jgi:hypothetical protein